MRFIRLSIPVFTVISLSGCTFYLLDGNGPREGAPSKLEPWVIEAVKAKRSGRAVHGQLDRYRLLSSTHPDIGQQPLRFSSVGTVMWRGEPTMQLSGDIIEYSAGEWGYLGGWSHSRATYDSETGEGIRQNHFSSIFVPFLISVHHSYEPIETDSNLYEEKSAFVIAFGALAFGQKNGRAYIQLAWIPIPLWSIRDARHITRQSQEDCAEP